MPKKNKKRKHNTRRTRQNNPAPKPEAFFEVEEEETIDQCLERIKKAGYHPVKRMEEPIFQEVEEKGEKMYEPIGKKIRFEVKVDKHEH